MVQKIGLKKIIFSWRISLAHIRHDMKHFLLMSFGTAPYEFSCKKQGEMLLFFQLFGLDQSCPDLVEMGQAKPEARKFMNFLVKTRGNAVLFSIFFGWTKVALT